MGRSGAVTFKGTPLTLAGNEVKVGSPAPDFKLHYFEGGMKELKLADVKGKPTIISVVPSLDTPVCDAQTKRFNDEAGKLPNVDFYSVSMDLPFAQSRWCGAYGVDHVKMLSDHRSGSFGENYGTLIKELRIESRAIFVVDAENKLRYVEYVKEVGDHPDYDAALNAVRQLVKVARAAS